MGADEASDGSDGPPRPAAAAPGPAVHAVRALARFEPGRPTFDKGLRAAMALGVITAVGAGVGELNWAVVAGMGGLNCAMADCHDDAYRRRLFGLGATVACNSIALTLGTVVGLHLWSALPVMAAVTFACGMACLFGEWTMGAGLTSSIIFMVGLGLAGDGSSPWATFIQCLAGGLITLVALMVEPPGRRLSPARRAVGGALDQVGDLYTSLGDPAMDRAGRRALVAQGDVARHGLHVADHVLAATIVRRPPERGELERLERILDTGRTMLAHGEGLAGLEADESPVAVPPEAVRAVDRATRETAGLLHHLAARARAGWPTVPSQEAGRDGTDADEPGALDDDLETIERVVDGLRRRARSEDFATIGILRPLQATLRAGADLLRGNSPPGAREPRPAPPAAPPVRSPRLVLDRIQSGARHVRHRLKSNLTARSSTFRRSCQFALTAMVGLVVGVELGLAKPYWITLTIAVILQPVAAPSLDRALLRVGGTLAGSLLAAVLLAVVVHQVGLIALVVVFAFLAFSFMRLNYALGVTFLTPLILVMVSIPNPGDWHLAVSRIVETLIGAGLAVLSGLVLWPGTAERHIAGEIGAAVTAQQGFLVATIAACRAGPDDPIRHQLVEPHRLAARYIDNAQGDLDRWLGDVPRQRDALGLLWSLVDELQSVYLEISAVADHLEDVDGRRPPSGLTETCDALEAGMEDLSAALESGRRPEMLSAALAEARVALDALGRTLGDWRDQRHRELARGGSSITAVGRSIQDYEMVEAALRRVMASLERMLVDSRCLVRA